MIRQFAACLACMLVTGTLHAQQAPETPPSSSQENPEVDTSPRRRARPHEYRNWIFNVGAGGNLAAGTSHAYVRGGGAVASVGVQRNYSKYFGFRLDFLWANLPLRTSALQLAQAPTGTNYAYGLSLNPVFSVPITSKYTPYGFIGPGFLRRVGSLDSSTVVRGSQCAPFWEWWGSCFAGSIPLNRNFLNTSQNEFGFDYGGGVARKVGERLEIYGEFRRLHGKHSTTTTDFKTLTIGLRW